ncbi:MAG: type II toxin-antitoxin system VapC family toxin [Pseudorhodoplanes sp.]|nr:MAG: type II toxin-antitoxin system VapC family toxin [Pseudorhodoplanes sp.]
MVIDTSALIALLRREPEADLFARAIEADPRRLISAVTKLEAGMVAFGRFGPAAAADLDALLAVIAPAVIPFDERQADVAREAFVRFGRGRHPAALNFGDCAAYALAVCEAEPLLFKGTDFSATDVAVVMPGGSRYQENIP